MKLIACYLTSPTTWESIFARFNPLETTKEEALEALKEELSKQNITNYHIIERKAD